MADNLDHIEPDFETVQTVIHSAVMHFLTHAENDPEDPLHEAIVAEPVRWKRYDYVFGTIMNLLRWHGQIALGPDGDPAAQRKLDQGENILRELPDDDSTPGGDTV